MSRKRTLLFELPFTLDSPRLTHPDHGISRLIQRRKGTFDREITVLDTPDHRLLRAGVTLEHRIDESRGPESRTGEWGLDAPLWQPWLPTGHTEPMLGSGDLPDDLSFLIRPFRRTATLGPVAAVKQQRVTYVIEDDAGVLLGTLRDERITIRRGGVTTARFREAVLAPTPQMNDEQKAFLIESLVAVGAVRVEHFPAPLKRLGAPGGGLSDFPEPRETDKKTSLEVCVSSLFATRLRDLVHADLALRAAEIVRRTAPDDSDDDAGRLSPGDSEPLSVAPLLDELAVVRREVHALSGVLQPTWREALEADLAAVLATDPQAPVGSLPERYYSVLDALISAARAPQLGDHSHRLAGEVLREQASGVFGVLVTRVESLRVDSPEGEWQAALFAARELSDAVSALSMLAGGRGGKLVKHLTRLRDLLEPAAAEVGMPSEQELVAMDSASAFARGLVVAAELGLRDEARRDLLEAWPTIDAKLSRLRSQR